MAETFRIVINIISIFAIPAVLLVFLCWGFFRKVKVYEVFVEGAKDGFNTAVRIREATLVPARSAFRRMASASPTLNRADSVS